MKFLVTGSTGLIGSHVVKDLTKKNHEVYSCFRCNEPEYGNPIKLDLVNHNEIKEVIKRVEPNCVIHLAAMTGVDQCEKEKDLAVRINADATEILAKQASKNHAFFLYVSTDYVFDGKKGLRKEGDSTNPLGTYGKTKLEGEIRLNKISSPCAIARTSTPFGKHRTKKTFPIWVRDNLESKNEIPVLIDQFTSPTYVPNLSKMLIEVATRQFCGTINLAGATRISRFDFAKLIAQKLGLDDSYLKPTKLSEMAWLAPRPKDSSLDVSWAREILNKKPQTIQQSLDQFVSEI